jgi:hypothetical protein
VRYLDSGRREAEQTVHHWLDEHLAEATYFACQTGYFGKDGLTPFAEHIKRMLAAGGEFHLVVGSNNGGVLSADLAYVLGLLEGHGDRGTLHLVGAPDVLMHPKTYYIESNGGVRHALVGSANLTSRGLTGNIEASMAMSSVEDPLAPFDEIRDAVLAWALPGRPNAIPVSLGNLAELIAEGATDAAPTKTSVEPSDKDRRRSFLFPALGRLVSFRRKTDKADDKAEEGEGAEVGTQGSALQLPGGAVGIVKVLSSLDTKAFRGETGTLYIALPLEIASLLPMAPAGRNDNPRLDVNIVAKLDSIPGESFVHVNARGNTNITFEGAGTSGKSHRDLRLNFLMPIARAILSAIQTHGVHPPEEGDVATIEFLSTSSILLTFVTQEPSKARLKALALAGTRGWAWLPASEAPAVP